MRAVFVLSLLLACGTTVAADRPPNVVVIMADDLGWGDLSCYGATAVQTPHCDRLAREGRRFTSGYCSASTCTPTRYSLLTGEYAFRLRGTGIAPPNGPAIIQPGTPTCASVLRQAGYATAVVGKWHLGLGEPGRGPDWNGVLAPGPLEIGFDHCFILPTTNDRVPSVFVEDHRVRGLDPGDPLWVGDARPSSDTQSGADRRPRLQMESSKGHDDSVHNGIGRVGVCTGGARARFRDEDLADAWARESVRWIEAHAGRPFFLFLAPHDIHVPRVPHERFRGATAMGPRGDCIVEFDWTVGQVLAALERLGIANDTLVILTSDNGPVLDDGYRDDAVEKLGDHRPAGPYRGGKYSVFEGGTRTPFIARWPGRIAPGVSDEIVCTIDLGRSVAAVVGAGVPAGAFPDAVDVSAALLGTGAGRRSLLLQDNGGSGRFGFRQGAWKLVREPVGGKRKGDGPRPVHDALYDLEGDPGETTDVGGGHPDVVRRLADEVDALTKPPPRRAGFRDAAARSPGGTAPAEDPLFEAFRTPGNDGKPFSYWWWKGNDVTRAEIARQLDLLHRAGIAGVHIVPLGKPAGDRDWLSPDWWRLVRHAVDEAKRRGMQVDINAGYGWPSGGTFVPAEHRLQAISCVIEKVRGPAAFERRIEDFLPANQAGLRSFAFVRLVPSRIERLSEVVDLGGHAHDGLLGFAVPPGEHFLYVGIHRLNARPNKVTGKAGDHALDYFDQVGVRKYLGHFADSLHAAVGARLGDLFHAFFVSSVEIWPANWTTGFADEFRRRRGYDPMPYAPFVTGMYPILLREAKHPRPDPFTASPECADEIRRARYDYNRTLVELFRENFVETTQRWCREQGVLFRYQAYGFPWNIGIGENYLVPDIPEGNNWVLGEDPERGWEVWNKYAAAGGHLTGKRVISNEAMTTQKGMFRETLDLVKRADDFNFITGNTRSVIHGFCYSPADAPPPGWHQYGTFLSEHNPWWPYFPRWTAYNARLSQVLQLADPVIDVAILGPTADVWSDDGLNRVALQTTPRYCYRLWESLSQQGVSADYLHEEVLQRAAFDGGRVNYGPMGYRLLILCDVASLEPSTGEAILRYVQAGGRLVIVGRGPERSPGLHDAAANDRRVRASLEAAFEIGGNRVMRVAAPGEAADLLAWTGGLLDRTRTARRVEFARPVETLFQVHSRAGGRDIFFLCNQDTERRVATAARFEAVAGTPWRWDPETGDRAVYPRADDGRVPIDLGPAESLLLVFEPDSPAGPVYQPAPVAGAVVKPIEEPWNLRLRSLRREESTLAAQPLEDFARIESLRTFAGTVDYQTSFVVTTADVAAARVLDLGRVNGVSEAWLNGRSLGARWYGDHHYPVSDVLQSGENTLRVRVATLVWNGVAEPDAPRESAGLPGPVVLRSGTPH